MERKHKIGMPCPLERDIADALTAAGIRFVQEHDGKEETQHLDFFLPDHRVYIEVKRFHADRVVKQMARVDNIIVVQGIEAVRMFCAVVASARLPLPEAAEG